MTDNETATIAPARSWSASSAGSTHGGEDYPRLMDSLRTFLDHVAGAKPAESDIRRLTSVLDECTATLAQTLVDEDDQVYFRRNDQPDRCQAMAPVFFVDEDTPSAISGTVTFGRYHLGGGGAVHGGAIAILFDNACGSFSNAHGRPPGRTAYLNVSFLGLAPIDETLQLTIRIDREEGRKRFLVGELRHGEVVCARAEALFVALRDHQG